MTREKLFEMIEYTDDRFLSRSEKNTVAIPVKKQKKVFPFMVWKIQYVAAAIAIVLLTSVTAVAAVTMIRRQAELKEHLGISGKEVSDYVEFDVGNADATASANATEGNAHVTVLSGVRDEQFQTWYFTVGPITEEDMRWQSWFVISDLFKRDAYPVWDYDLLVEEVGLSVDEETGYEGPSVYDGDPNPNAGSYDAETQTLLLRLDVSFKSYDLPASRTEPIECTIISCDKRDELSYATWVEDSEYDEGGYYAFDIEKALDVAKYRTTATFTPTVTDVNTRTVVFGNSVHFTNPDTGAQGTITDVEIYANGSIHMHYTIPEDADTMDRFFNQGASMPNAEYLDLQDNVFLPWSNAADEVMSGMTINLKDGTRLGGSVSARLTYNNGVLDAEGSAERMIALDEIESVTIAGQTFEVE